MKTKLLIPAIALAFVAPMFASAQLAVSTDATVKVSIGTTTQAQIFTACSQASIETRDTAIAAARTAYNTSMAAALTARKDAEKNAVTIIDIDQNRIAIQVAVDAYKKAATTAQDTLTKARLDAWASFEKDMENCRQYKSGEEQTFVAEKKAMITEKQTERKDTVTAKKAEIKTLQVEHKTEVQAKQAEVKSIRESFKAQLNAFLAFFTRKQVVNATTTVNATTSISQ